MSKLALGKRRVPITKTFYWWASQDISALPNIRQLLFMRKNLRDTPGTDHIRTSTMEDINAIVAIHQISFDGFFLDRMGPNFLKVYYRTILDYDRAILLVHIDETGEIDGFAAGFKDREQFYRHFRSYRGAMLVPIIRAVLRRPRLVFEIGRNRSRVASVAEPNPHRAELSSIGTKRRNTGVGSKLLIAFCDQASRLEASAVTLTTDRDGNDDVVRFYERHGFEIDGTEERHGRVLNTMTRNLPNR